MESKVCSKFDLKYTIFGEIRQKLRFVISVTTVMTLTVVITGTSLFT